MTVHQITKTKFNFHEDHYQKIYEMSFKDSSEEIKSLAKENLKLIGEVYNE